MLKKYMIFIAILTGISIVLGMSYSNFIVASENHKVAEMYVGRLKYSMTINGSTKRSLTIEPEKTIIVDVNVTNENPIDTYYKLVYKNNTNLSITYYESTQDTEGNTTNYNPPNDKITANNTNNIKIKIVNNSTSSQKVNFGISGGFATNTLEDVIIPSTGTEIKKKDESTNTYFCTTTDTLTQGLQYINGQYTYAYKLQSDIANGGEWSYIYAADSTGIVNEVDGWGVIITDKKSADAVTSKLCTYINNKPVVSMSSMFFISQAPTIDVSSFNTSNIINMESMFSGSQAATLDLSNFDTSNVTSMYRMFDGNRATTINLSSFDTSKVTNMGSMFSGISATTIDLSSFDTSNVTDMDDMFHTTSKLETIYVDGMFVTDNVEHGTDMFTNCYNLVGGAGTTYNNSYVDKTYAHIDGGTSNPGYFTDVADKDILEPNSFATDSWKTIAKAVRTNNTSKYNIGDTRTINMGTYGTHTLRIANTSTPSECSTAGFSQSACGFVLEFTDIITSRTMNDTATNVGGWPASSMYKFVNNDIYNALPSELKNVIINTTNISSHGKTQTENFTSTDKLYLLSTGEIWSLGTSSPIYSDSARDVTRQLDYYKDNSVALSNYGGAKKSNSWYYLRSAYNIDDAEFIFVADSGGLGYGNATTNAGVSPAFRIG